MFADLVNGSIGKLGGRAATAIVGAAFALAVPRAYFWYFGDPTRNLSIFPVYIEPMDVCNVNRARLAEKLPDLKKTQSDDADATAFLQTIESSQPKKGDAPFQMLRSQMPANFSELFNREGICMVTNGAGQQDVVNTTILKIQAAAVVRDQSQKYSYLIDRRCHVTVDGLPHLKMTVAVSENDIVANDSEDARDATPLEISGNKTFYLKYDSRFSEGVYNSEFQKLIDMIAKSERFGINVECGVLDHGDRRWIRADKAFQFAGRRPADDGDSIARS